MKYVFYKNLYLTEKAANDTKIIRNLKRGKPSLNDFVITLASPDSENLLEICRACLYCQKIYKKSRRYVVGLAKAYDEACQLAADIVSEVHSATNHFDIRSYLDFFEEDR